MIMDRLSSYLEKIGIDDSVLDGWDVQKAYRDGEFVGYVIIKGCEIHMLSTNDSKAMSRKNITEFISPLIDTYGYCTTRVPLSEENHKLRKMLGFVRAWEDEQFSYWTLTEMPFQRKRP